MPKSGHQSPIDLQQIILEEAAKSELEALRIAAIQNEMGLLKNTSDDPRGAGIYAMEFVPFSEEMIFRSSNTAVVEHVLPAWVNRGWRREPYHHCRQFQQQGGPDRGSANRRGRYVSSRSTEATESESIMTNIARRPEKGRVSIPAPSLLDKKRLDLSNWHTRGCSFVPQPSRRRG